MLTNPPRCNSYLLDVESFIIGNRQQQQQEDYFTDKELLPIPFLDSSYHQYSIMFSRLYDPLPLQTLLSQPFLTPFPPQSRAATCHASPLRLFARLSLPNKYHSQIFGYLPRAREDPNPGFLYLTNPVLASLHIMGPDWRSHLISPPESTPNPKSMENPTSLIRNFSYMPIPHDDNNEAQHCLRMKRCGALWEENVLEWMNCS